MPTPPLTDVEARILGSLIEKKATTPDNYPLSLSALTAACNQTSNREPVMRLEEGLVDESVVTLRRRGWLRAIQPAGSRVTKYQHLLPEVLDIDERELAVLAVLMLRGEQTPGELHTRTARLAQFEGIADIDATLERLIARESEPLVARLPRRAGQKELRYAHLLSGPPVHNESLASSDTVLRTPPLLSTADQRLATLEQELVEVREELAALRGMFDEFRAQFQ